MCQAASDITANAFDGSGGNITIASEGIFGISKRPNNPLTNDLTTSSDTGISGNISITPPDINPIQGAVELPTNIVVPEQTVAQACRSNRERLAQGGFTISGKGGITPNPSSPLNTLNVYVDGDDTKTDTPEALETSQGKIQPARGVRVTDKGIMLTAYRTNNKGDRLPESNSSCDRQIPKKTISASHQ